MEKAQNPSPGDGRGRRHEVEGEGYQGHASGQRPTQHPHKNRRFALPPQAWHTKRGPTRGHTSDPTKTFTVSTTPRVLVSKNPKPNPKPQGQNPSTGPQERE